MEHAICLLKKMISMASLLILLGKEKNERNYSEDL
jgi:hypothetical protein